MTELRKAKDSDCWTHDGAAAAVDVDIALSWWAVRVVSILALQTRPTPHAVYKRIG